MAAVRSELKRLRTERGLTQSEVAKALGITRQFYGMIESGDRNPTVDLAIAIANLFCASVEDLFADAGSNISLQSRSQLSPPPDAMLTPERRCS